MQSQKMNYGEAIRTGFQYLLSHYSNVFCIGQGLWSPWYVGNSMTNFEQEFSADRIIDSPVSELACTGVAIGASLCGYRPIIIHPRMDFMLLATDQIVNQAAKWSYTFSGQAHPQVTIRAIINRGGEQGAQHSQALHAMYAHIPGLRVVMPASVADARDLLIASVLCDDPVLYIDDRWLYPQEDFLPPINADLQLAEQGPRVVCTGSDITLAATSYSVTLAMQAKNELQEVGIFCEVIDLRVINPLDISPVIRSVKKTGRLCVIDGGWKNCGLGGEVIAATMERIDPNSLHASPLRVTLPSVPAPCSKPLEDAFYPKVHRVIHDIKSLFVSTKNEATI